MVLSAALDSGYVFLTLIAILTSVVSAVYYLNIIKQIFFETPDYKPNPVLENKNLEIILLKGDTFVNKIKKLCLTIHYLSDYGKQDACED